MERSTSQTQRLQKAEKLSKLKSVLGSWEPIKDFDVDQSTQAEIRQTIACRKKRVGYGTIQNMFIEAPSSGEDSDEDATSYFSKIPSVKEVCDLIFDYHMF